MTESFSSATSAPNTASSLTQLTLGFMPLTDCAPLVIAKELGMFEQAGLEVSLARQNSWAALRDKIHAGVIDAGQMLAPMPLASTLGVGGVRVHVMTPLVLSRNGNAITFSEPLWQEVLEVHQLTKLPLPLSASYLKPIIEQRKAKGKRLRFATVYPYSCHYYQLLSWLAQGRIAMSDVEIVIIPPVKMVDALEQGIIDGFCVGGPWNAKAVRQKIGLTGLTSSDIWPDFPEKVLGIRETLYAQRSEVFQRLVAVILQSCHWLESIPNRLEAARILCRKEYLDTDLDVVAPSLLGSCLTHHTRAPRHVPAYNQFSSQDATGDSGTGNCPEPNLGDWIANQMLAAKHIRPEQLQDEVLKSVYRADIYRQIVG